MKQQNTIRMELDRDWHFHRGAAKRWKRLDHDTVYAMTKAGQEVGDMEIFLHENDWTDVSVPHDWSTMEASDPDEMPDNGFKPRGEGWYYTKVQLPAYEDDACVTLTFEGIMGESVIYVNGVLAERNPSGYTAFNFEISDYVLPGEAAEIVHFHQCKACGFVAFSDEELTAHLVAAHLGDYWTAEEIECEPPKGSFTCVAKCGLSGELLGPPNLHGYDARIREMIRTRYPNMSESAYRARIEIVRDQEAVEAWRQSATKKTVFKKKGEADAPAVEREAAEMDFRMQIAPSMMSTPKAVDVPADVALKASNRAFVFACRDALEFEKRRPRNLSFALHGAFHHRKLEFFRANDPRGPEFVVAVKPTPLDTAHAVPELAELVKCVEARGEMTRAELLAALADGDEKKATDVKSHIAWLVEKGHLIGFSDGMLAVPSKFPKHMPPSRKQLVADADNASKKPCPTDETTDVSPVVNEAAPEQSKEEPKAEEPKVEIQEEVKKDETADQLAE